MQVEQQEGNRGTDVAFLNVMHVIGESILKLIGIKKPKRFKAKSIVLKDKQLFPDIYAWPFIGSDDIRIFLEFQGYKDPMIRFRVASKVSLFCAQEAYIEKVQPVIIYTEKRFFDVARPMQIMNADNDIAIQCNFKEIILEDYTLEELMAIDKRLILLAPFTASKKHTKKKRIALCHEWAALLKEIYPPKMHINALDIMSIFILNRFRNLSLEEVRYMLNFDLSTTRAGKQLIHIGEESGVKQGVKQGAKNEKIKTAKLMLKKGMEPKLIKEITRLPKKEIQKLLH